MFEFNKVEFEMIELNMNEFIMIETHMIDFRSYDDLIWSIFI